MDIRDVYDVIELLKKDAYAVSLETKVYPSVFLSVAIYEYYNYGDYFLKTSKNPYNSSLKENTYFSFRDAMRKFATVNKIYSKEILTDEHVLEKIYTDKDIIKEILNISKQFDLNQYNKEFIEAIIDTDGPIIDISKEPKVQIYTVKRYSNNSTLLRTNDLDEAIKVCDINAGSMVLDSKNNIVHGVKDIHKFTTKNVIDISSYKNFTIGTKINLLKANLYEKWDSKVPKRSISGTFIISSNVKNNRYRISSVTDNTFIIGYVETSAIEKIK